MMVIFKGNCARSSTTHTGAKKLGQARDEWRDADRRQSRSDALEDRKRDNGEEPIPDIEPGSARS
jgi:hypothetical protein